MSLSELVIVFAIAVLLGVSMGFTATVKCFQRGNCSIPVKQCAEANHE